MAESTSAFYGFLRLPVSFIRRDEYRARQVALSGFSKRCDENVAVIVCRKNSAHKINVTASNAEIDEILKAHSPECAVKNDFPTEQYLNFSSHRLLTLLLNENVPNHIGPYKDWAATGFYYCVDTGVIKCHSCSVELPKKVRGPALMHRLLSPTCIFTQRDTLGWGFKPGDVSLEHEFNSNFSGFVIAREKICKSRQL
jgi:hypothetical protein